MTFGMTPAFVGFIVVALVGTAAEMASAFSGARKNRLDLSVGIALGSASQIALFVAPVLVLLSYVIGPAPMVWHFVRARGLELESVEAYHVGAWLDQHPGRSMQRQHLAAV